jgi:predicted nuclease of predicted toxin-antitoxin system
VKFVADESVEGPTIIALRAAGHVVLSIAESTPGIDDEAVLRLALQEQALLVTADKDFGELVFRGYQQHCGILLIRAVEESLEENATNAVAAIERYGADLRDSFSVLTRRAIRIRKG